MTDTITNDVPLAINGITWRKITDQIVAGIEGGISYWAHTFKPDHEVKTDNDIWYDDEKFWAGSDWKVRVGIHDDEDKFLTPESIKTGLKYLADNHLWRIEQIVKETGDAETGDVFIQACLFGDIVYG